MRARAPLFAATIALLISVAASATAAEKVWSGLVIAENAEKPATAPVELKKFEQTMKELFGYNQFNIIGQSSKTLKTGQEDWLASSKYFSLHVDSRGETAAGYVLNLKLYKENELLLETEAKLSKESPLIIKGPQVGSGQLLLVLVVDGDEWRKQSEDSSQRPHGKHEASFVNAVRRFTRVVRNALP
jgi:hypothetical protein